MGLGSCCRTGYGFGLFLLPSTLPWSELPKISTFSGHCFAFKTWNSTPNDSRFVRGMSQRDIAGLWAHTTAFISGFACAIRCRGVLADVFWKSAHYYISLSRVCIDRWWLVLAFIPFDWLGTWYFPICERTAFAARRLAQLVYSCLFRKVVELCLENPGDIFYHILAIQFWMVSQFLYNYSCWLVFPFLWCFLQSHVLNMS